MASIRKTPEEIVAIQEEWLRETVRKAGASGGIVGLSGGIDSAVVAVLLKRVFGDNMLVVKMPCHSLSEDEEHADLMIEKFHLPCRKVDLSSTYDSLLSEAGENFSSISLANVKPRLRMTTLYMYAQDRGYLVCGTSNAAELTVGYFTKFGDSGSDILPLAELTKGEVKAVARYLGVPDEIVEKDPSAGLWEGQTDEKEMGLSYADIDSFILTGHCEEEAQKKIERRFASSEHKRKTAEICHLF